MAIFSNQATLTVGGVSVDSNIAYGEILDVLSATKTALEDTYTQNELVTYVVTLRNTGNTVLTGLTVTDNLGAYDLNGNTVYPLTYETDTVAVFADGVPQATPAVTAGPPLVITGISVPADGDVVIVYQARVNAAANPTAQGIIVNTVTVTGDGLSAPVTATETVTAEAAPALNITKSISPAQVVDNDRVTYTFVITNTGNTPVIATDNAVITDTFDPILTNLVVTYNGTAWTEGTEYTYNAATGAFATVAGNVTVPAATYTQDPVTGIYTVTPGVATLVVTGTI